MTNRRRGLAALLVAASLGAACVPAVPPPAEAQQGITQQEARTGAQAHPQVTAQFGGPYADPELQAYVSRIGERLKNVTPMRDEKFTFTLLDSDVVNAFAIPGGYVYVTRGLMSLARDEAELAGVLAHEIAHVVAHHSAGRQSRSAWGSIFGPGGQVAGAVLGGWLGGDAGARLGAQLGGQFGSLGAQAWVQGYSREQELESDQLGINYLEGAGYEPRAMASFLEQLEGNSRLETELTGRRNAMPSWLQSHPRTADRVVKAAEAAASATPGAREQNRDRYLAAVDGMVYGDNPAQGFVRGRTFEHPELGFRFTAPPGFALKNTPAAVLGTDRQGRVMKFDMARGRAADAKGFLTQVWGREAQLQDVRSFSANGLDAAAAFAPIQIDDRRAEAMLVAIEAGGDEFYRFVFADPRGLGRDDAAEFGESAKSFERLAPGEAEAVKPSRLRVHTVRSGDTQESLARLMEVEKLPLETFRVLNGLEAGQPLRPGDAVKIVVRG